MPGARRLVPWVVVAVSGCSLAISGPDPARPAGEAPRCDTGKSMVGVDGVLGTVLGIGALSLLGDNEGVGAAVLGLSSVVLLASAVRGNRLVNECREAFEVHAQGPGLPVDDEPNSTPRLALPGRAPGATVPAQPPPPAQPPVRTAAPDDEVTDGDFGDGDAEPTVAPVAVPAPAPRAPKRSPQAAAGAWRDFWTEVP